ncbi:Arc family DNA-binding protein [Bradyrhizobium sp.]|uniref:Arc family DNA-binding protein n=1 Tax=Bradyrhizobium sp. TaxID=376 RepID=UPI0025C181C9|nr:Arc family DNA-binding protein [Bradyrhizobium sp.]
MDKFNVRLPPGLRDRLHALAKANGRSANAELVDRLEKSIGDIDDTKKLLAGMSDLVLEIAKLVPRSADVAREAEKLRKLQKDQFDGNAP